LSKGDDLSLMIVERAGARGNCVDKKYRTYIQDIAAWNQPEKAGRCTGYATELG
jgi:hypothetical protein